MEKENKYFLLFIVIIVCALLGALIWVKMRANDIRPVASSREDESATAQTVPVEVPSLTDSKVVMSDQAKRYDVEVHFPVVALAQHPEFAKDANAVIRSFASDTIESFVRDIDEMYSPNVPKEFVSDLSVRWSALLLSPTIISIRFDESSYTAGAAHPNSQTRILNYDMEKHLLLQTRDLFASSTLALSFLSSYTREKLRAVLSDQPQELYDSQALPGTEPTTENFSTVGLTKQGLLVVFSPYQVAPYARGTIHIPIPLPDLTNLLSQRVVKAMEEATTNIVEATPIETSTSSQNGLNE
jgi:hypothetical protein